MGDTISVAAGTYLESGLLIDKSVDITGAGMDVTVIDGSVNGVNGPQIFKYPGSGFRPTSTLSQMTIRGGARGVDAGGGNVVTLDHVRVTANGPATGAGVFNGASQLTVKSSLIDNNSATDEGSIAGCDWGGASGGGIASLCGGGNNYISDSTITGNTAGRWGGGLIINDGTSVIENTTISGNHANFNDPGLGGGALFMGGAFPDILVRFSTIANNTAAGTGGIQGDEKVRLYATVLQGNTGVACAGAVASLGYNVVDDASCAFSQPGDGLSTSAQLQPLAMNGGDTATHALPKTSPAVDRVPEAECTVFADQRGVARPQGGACDSGAYEYVFTAQDLIATLIAQLNGAGLGHGFIQSANAILVAINYGYTGIACSGLGNMSGNIYEMAMRHMMDPMKAAAILHTIDDIAHSVGCY